MRTARNSQIMRTIPLLIAICLFSFPVYAQYSGGTGEPNDPYHIATAEDLMLLGDSPEDYDKHFILTDDIDLDPNLPEGRIFTKALIAPNSVYPFRETRTTFTGSFNGNNHVIHNLVIDGSGDLGIFGFIGSNGQVKNLHVENVVINSKDSNVGGLAGENWGIITDCHISGYVYGRSDIGGLVGKNGSYVLIRSGADTQYNANGISNEFIEGKILACSADVNVVGIEGGSGSQSIGGLVGENSGGIISCCRSSGSAIGKTKLAGLQEQIAKGRLITATPKVVFKALQM